MLATAQCTKTPQTPDVICKDLVFRICGGPRDGQIMHLKSPKCSIGAGRWCTLRLLAPGVAQLHCLILRGPAGTIVRRWAPDTRLNHRAFTDSPLRTGDRLDVGPVQLEVVSLGTVSLDMDLTWDQPGRTSSIAANTPAPSDQDLSLQAEREALAVQRHELDQQAAQLAQRERELDNRSASLARRETELSEQKTQINARLAELQAQAEELEKKRQNWQLQQEQERADLETQRRQLAEQLSACHVEIEALEWQRRQWETEQAEAKRQLETQRAELAAIEADLQARRDEMARQQSQAEQQASAPPESFEPQAALSDEPTPDAEQPPQQIEELKFEAPAEEAPVNLSEVFRRVGANVEFAEQPAPRRLQPEQVEPPATKPCPQPTATSTAPSHSDADEESIEDYMSRLMQRMRTADAKSSMTYQTKQSEPEPGLESELAAAPTTTSAPSMTSPAVEHVEPVAPMPRRVAPEKRVDLSALRELANLSAHAAISKHSRHVLVSTMYSKLLVAAVALACGGALFWLWGSFGAWQMTFYSALTALLVAIYWGVEYAILTGRLIVSKSGHIDIDWNVSPHAKRSTPPAETPAEPDAIASGESPAESTRQ